MAGRPAGSRSQGYDSGVSEARVRALMGALRDYRLELGISQDSLYQRCGVDRNIICKVERAASNPDGSLPQTRTLAAMAHSLGLDLSLVRAADRGEAPLLVRQTGGYLALLDNNELRVEADDVAASVARQLGAALAGSLPGDQGDDRLVTRLDLLREELVRRGLPGPGEVVPAEGDDCTEPRGASAEGPESPLPMVAEADESRRQLMSVYWPHPPRFAGDELPEPHRIVRVAGGRAYRAEDSRWYTAVSGPDYGRLIAWPVYYWAPILDGENPGYILPDPGGRGSELERAES